MKTYFAKFISGAEEIVETYLKNKDIDILMIEDGIVVFKTNKNQNELNQLNIFNSNFLLLYSFKNIQTSINHLRKVAMEISNKSDLLRRLKMNAPKTKTGFKVQCILENDPISIGIEFLSKLEDKIASLKNLYLDIKKPKIEFLLIVRRSGNALFGFKKISKLKRKKITSKGSIRKELAVLLSILSKPKKNDIVLDPFAGSGVILIERAAISPFKKIIAVENAKQIFNGMKSNIKRNKMNIEMHNGDAFNMEFIESATIDKIITDPPWGEFNKIESLDDFYIKMFHEFDRVLKKTGIIILLLFISIDIETIIENQFKTKFKIKEKYRILVSGKKSSIYKIVKSG